MKISDKRVVAIAAIFLIFGLWWYGFLRWPADIAPPEIPGAPPTTPTGRSAAALKFALRNAITEAAIITGNSYADITKVGSDGTIDFSTRSEGPVTVNSSPEYSAETYAEGDLLIFHLSSDADPTGGTDYYDRWYYVKLVEGESVRRFTADLITPVQTSPTYKYKFKSGAQGVATTYKVQYVEGDTNYWGLGQFEVVPRVSAANLDTYLLYGGSTGSSITDGTTFDTTAGASNNIELSTDDEEVTLKLDAGAVSVAYGCEMITLTSKYQLQTRKAIAVFSTTMTMIGTTKLTDADYPWSKIADSTLTSEVAYYCIVPEQIPRKGSDFELNIPLPIDASAASSSTQYTFKVWLIDFQLESDIASGTCTSSVPSAYGMVGEYGLDAMIFARPYATSSGAGTTQVLTAVIATCS